MSLQSPLNPQTGSNRRRRTAPIPPSNDVIDVDNFVFTPVTHKGTDKTTPISVEHYALDRDLQLAIAASLAVPLPHLINLSSDDDDDVSILAAKPENTPFGKRRKRDNNENEKGESSNSAPPFICKICTETKSLVESFCVTGCHHSYCNDCVILYVGSKLQENVINIRCPVPGCKGLLELEDCREILPKEVFDRWGMAMCEAVVVEGERFYCPFKDCSALMINDGRELVRQSECPNCRRLFCAQCKVAWHDGIGCDEFQTLNKDEREKEDIMLMNLAKTKKWRRCPMCKYYVEKSEGCMYMKCRCGYAFCYSCGALSNKNTHYCSSCKR
ncbi:E3 ubiquitin-protein ligase RSL1 [Arachis duranensis]|uniref:RBR-type E3 ubiquitin transferase n=1 Tax=Arachis duranensis TaxID=130453 RepID=A0A6P4CQH0_ARADU|nr:E3 ubiquitin-protein ligase RSL1 [Arachis duranensis]